MKGVCSVDGCNTAARTKGLCNLHYQRQWRIGSVHVFRPCLRGTTEEKFWRYVTKGAEDECWEWQGFRDKDGYGKLRTGKTNESAHRISFRLHNGSIEKSLMVLHKCNNPPCCNPRHLYQGNQTQNMKDRAESGNAPLGEGHPNCKFSDAVVEAVRAAAGTYEEIAAQHGMSRSQVGNIKRGSQRQIKTAPHKVLPAVAKIAAAERTKGRACTWGDKVAESVRKLSPEEAAVVKYRLSQGEKVKDLAAEYGMHRTSISKIKMGTYFLPYRKNAADIRKEQEGFAF